MITSIYNLDGEAVEEIELPAVFDTPYRPDVIKRAVIASQTARIQPWGADEMGGKRTSASSFGKGRGLSRVPRVRGGGFRRMSGAFAPGTVGGRKAHPPKPEKNIVESINKKERKLAIRSAIAASADKDLVSRRGHVLKSVLALPVVVTDDFQEIWKTDEVLDVLTTLGLDGDIKRAKESKKTRAGKGKMRGRKYKSAKGPLLVISEDKGVYRSARNLPGVDITPVSYLNCELLAPGTHPGRLVLWTKSAIEKLGENF